MRFFNLKLQYYINLKPNIISLFSIQSQSFVESQRLIATQRNNNLFYTKKMSDKAELTKNKNHLNIPIASRELYKITKSTIDSLHRIYESNLEQEVSRIETVYNELSIKPDSPFLIRLDGCGFSKYTKNVKKPFDDRITNSMIKTSIDLIDKFQCVTIYVQSDEINMVFLPQDVEPIFDELEMNCRKRKKIESRVHMYNGRLQKLVSVTAAYATARFNYHINKMNWEDIDLKSQEMIKENSAYFDSRMVAITNLEEACKSIYLRSNLDGIRNAISHITIDKFKKDKLPYKSVQKQLNMLKEINVEPSENYDLRNIFGVFIKKEIVETKAINKKTNQEVIVTRNKVCGGNFDFSKLTLDERISFIQSKFWLNDDQFPPKNYHYE